MERQKPAYRTQCPTLTIDSEGFLHALSCTDVNTWPLSNQPVTLVIQGSNMYASSISYLSETSTMGWA